MGTKATNGGLYLKIGQAIAMQSAVLPPEFQKMFARMFDDAPQNSWQDVERVIREDFAGKSPEEVFGVSFTNKPGSGVIETKARASASVAQVHWARLADGREVAVKVQKREIASQVGWDLWAFNDESIHILVRPSFIQSGALHYRTLNVRNGLLAGEPRLNGRVYIPKVYRDLSSKRVMTTEWIEGVRLWDKEALTAPCGEWRGRHGKGGLGLSLKQVMTTMVDLFSAQMFLWGVVHCDPHPGNIFIRRQPNGQPELVLIDHGLYVYMTPEFRHQYCQFWKAIMTFDNASLNKITSAWGVKAPDLFALLGISQFGR
ncbi:hypothetical protein SS1G_04326 [Sclerotinia sclerotiorum 1980 UF-70]|uniref:Protein kinase domain-containing protein n=1 Tax=Sclerotinia sclerotiorum (strain ATCC 18683 / 1980 / Ss-1) TaxID=665079 RepID=A7EG85_SCLS1|nr:hypothetical protein SS1G_04326 [Sclerotinia sclerotiorum 1980 UF-70]EDO01851.1 hypothetical protein SS1G_04326 [Sclerotinia sclerotiorum 1980 UF-70]